MPRTFWYYAMKHLAQMMNMIPGKYRNKLAPPSCSSTVYAPIQELGSLSSRYVTSITRRTVMPRALSHRPTPWTGSSSVDPPPRMPSSSTTLGISAITNPTATKWTHIESHHLFIPQSSMTAASLFLYIATTTRPSANRTPLEQESLTSIHHLNKLLPAPLWISRWTPTLPLNISSSSMMARHDLSQQPTCHP